MSKPTFVGLEEAVSVETGNLWQQIEWLTIQPVLESLPEEDQILLYEYAAVDGNIHLLAKNYNTTPTLLQQRIDNLLRYIREECGLDEEPIH